MAKPRNPSAEDGPHQIPTPLVGMWFVEIEEDGKGLGWAGRIVGNPEPGWYVLHLVEWLLGTFSLYRLVDVARIARFHLHATKDDLEDDLEHGRAAAIRKWGDRKEGTEGLE